MTHRISQSIAYFLLRKSFISEEKINVYIYGFEIIISDALLILGLLIIMMIFNLTLEMCAFLIVFITLRHQAGGYHASNHLKCNIIFVTAFGIVILLLKILSLNAMNCCCLITSFAGLILIYILAPIESPNKPVSKERMCRYRRNSLIYSDIIIVFAIVVMYFFKMHALALSISLGVFNVGIALLAEHMKRREAK